MVTQISCLSGSARGLKTGKRNQTDLRCCEEKEARAQCNEVDWSVTAVKLMHDAVRLKSTCSLLAFWSMVAQSELANLELQQLAPVSFAVEMLRFREQRQTVRFCTSFVRFEAVVFHVDT